MLAGWHWSCSPTAASSPDDGGGVYLHVATKATHPARTIANTRSLNSRLVATGWVKKDRSGYGIDDTRSDAADDYYRWGVPEEVAWADNQTVRDAHQAVLDTPTHTAPAKPVYRAAQDKSDAEFQVYIDGYDDDDDDFNVPGWLCPTRFC